MSEDLDQEFGLLRPAHHIGGFLLSPREYCLIHLQKLEISRKNPLQSSWWYKFLIGLIFSLTLAFFVFYPEVYLYPKSIKGESLNLFIFMLSDPLMIGGTLVGGFLLIFGFDLGLQGSISYFLIRSGAKKQYSRDFDLKLNDYLKIYGFGGSYTLFFSLSLILWIYFFERFSFAKPFFPVANVTVPFLIQVLTFVGCIIGKWVYEFKINRAVLQFYNIQSIKSAIIVVCYKIAFVIILLSISIVGSNVIAAQYS